MAEPQTPLPENTPQKSRADNRSDPTDDPAAKLARISMALSALALIALLLTKLIALPMGLVFFLLIASGAKRGRIHEKKLTPVSNILALLFLLLVCVIGLQRGLLETFIESLPYLLMAIQIYYLVREKLENRFYYFLITVIMTLVQAALIQNYSVFVILFASAFILLFKGAAAAEEARLRRAALKGREVRAQPLLRWPWLGRRLPSSGQDESSDSGPGQSLRPIQHPFIQGVAPSGLRRLCAPLIFLLAVSLIFMAMPRAQVAGSMSALNPQQDNNEAQNRIGFTERVSHGKFGSLSEDNTVVMSVHVERRALPNRALRWRGKALNRFDGLAWTSDIESTKYHRYHFDGFRWIPSSSARDAVHPDRRGYYFFRSKYKNVSARSSLTPVRFRVSLKGADTVFSPPRPEMITAFTNAIFMRDFNDAFSLQQLQVRNEELNYTVWCGQPPADQEQRLRDARPFDRSAKPDMAKLFLHLPQDLDPRIAQLGNRITENMKPHQAAQAIAGYLERECTYSLDPQTTPKGADPLADFLFRAKTGHCEYFASAMAVLLRTQGIPSRVVAGFQRGEWNDLGKFFTVRQRDAHAWVEAFFNGVGWVTFDPSPRVRENIAFMNRRGWWQKSVMPYVDVLDDLYYSQVMNYNQSSQSKLYERTAGAFNYASRPFLRAASWLLNHPLLILALIVLALAGATFWLLRGRRDRKGLEGLGVPSSYWQMKETGWGQHGKAIAQAYLRVRSMLDESAQQHTMYRTARESVLHAPFRTLPEQQPALEALRELTALYERARFATEDFSRAEYQQALKLAAQIKKALQEFKQGAPTRK